MRSEIYDEMYMEKLVADFKQIGWKQRRETTKPYKNAAAVVIRTTYSDGSSKEKRVGSWSSKSELHAIVLVLHRTGFRRFTVGEKKDAGHGTIQEIVAAETVKVEKV